MAQTDAERESAKIQLVKTLRQVDLREQPLSLEKSGTSLRKMTHTLGRDQVHGVVMALLVNLNDYFNVSKGLNTYQIIEIAEMIMSEYENLRIEELVFIFQRSKMEAELFGSLDGSKIFGWLKDYETAKENDRHTRHLQQKNSDFLTYLPAGFSHKYKIMTDSMRKKYEAKNEAMRTGEAIIPVRINPTRKAKSTKRPKKGSNQ